MPVSKKQQASVNKYRKKVYDMIQFTVPKGERDAIREHAEARGESLAAFIRRAIAHEMERDNSQTEPDA